MIGVLTCPRKVNYLPDTIRQIDQSATSTTKVILSDGAGEILAPSDWLVFRSRKPESEGRRENRYPFWEMLSVAATVKEDLIFFEDDLILSKNATVYLERMEIPEGVALVSAFALNESERGIEVKSTHSFQMCQCMKIPLHTCVYLVSKTQEMLESKFLGSDGCLKDLMSSANMKFGTLYPNIVQHIGDESAVMGCSFGRFKSLTFAGTDFDCLSLSTSQEVRRYA